MRGRCAAGGVDRRAIPEAPFVGGDWSADVIGSAPVETDRVARFAFSGGGEGGGGTDPRRAAGGFFRFGRRGRDGGGVAPDLLGVVAVTVDQLVESRIFREAAAERSPIYLRLFFDGRVGALVGDLFTVFVGIPAGRFRIGGRLHDLVDLRVQGAVGVFVAVHPWRRLSGVAFGFIGQDAVGGYFIATSDPRDLAVIGTEAFFPRERAGTHFDTDGDTAGRIHQVLRFRRLPRVGRPTGGPVGFDLFEDLGLDLLVADARSVAGAAFGPRRGIGRFVQRFAAEGHLAGDVFFVHVGVLRGDRELVRGQRLVGLEVLGVLDNRCDVGR